MSFRGMCVSPYHMAYELVKEGMVEVKVKKGLLKSYKIRWLRLLREVSCQGRCRLEIFENAVGSLTQNPYELLMVFQGDRALVFSKGVRCGVQLHLRDFSSSYKFITHSLFEADLWTQLINESLNRHPSTSPTSSFISRPSFSSPPISTQSIHSPILSDLQPNNTFPTPTIKKHHSTISYLVKVPPTHHSPWQTTIDCILELSASHLFLISNTESREVVLRWSIEAVRRYGWDQMSFVLEPEKAEDRVTVVSQDSSEIYSTFHQLSTKLCRRSSKA